jgi:hypothetical protein
MAIGLNMRNFITALGGAATWPLTACAQIDLVLTVPNTLVARADEVIE